MKLDLHPRGWRFLERGALWAIFATCTFVATQPLRNELIAWQNQHALEAQWQQALQNEHNESRTAAPHPITEHLVSRHHPTPSAAKKDVTAKTDGDLKKNGDPKKDAATNTEQHMDAEQDATQSDSEIMWPLLRLSCSRMKLDALVVQGTSDLQLKRGPGHEVDTSLPGGPNCVIAAHRNAYGWWFYRLNDLQPGDFVALQVPGRKFLYRVALSRIVSVYDTSILHSRPKAAPRLTLYSCTLPKTQRRLVVIANLASSEAT